MIDLIKDNYKQSVIDTEIEAIPSIVDFSASWCGPCKVMVNLILPAVETEFSGKVNFYKVNVDEEIELTKEYNIRNLPTLVFYQNGRELLRITGITQKEALIEKINKTFSF